MEITVSVFYGVLPLPPAAERVGGSYGDKIRSQKGQLERENREIRERKGT